VKTKPKRVPLNESRTCDEMTGGRRSSSAMTNSHVSGRWLR